MSWEEGRGEGIGVSAGVMVEEDEGVDVGLALCVPVESRNRFAATGLSKGMEEGGSMLFAVVSIGDV